MIYDDLIKKLGFIPKENTSAIFHKKYADNYLIEVDFENKKINFGDLIKSDVKTTQNFSQAENWVVLECVNRLLEKGYSAKNITLEKVFPSGHGTSGRLDILVLRDDGTAYLMIECKTYGSEFDKEFNKLKKDGGQLFTYFQQDKNADILMLYASQLGGQEIVYRNEIIKIEDDYRQTGNVKDFYDRWNKLPKNNGVFDEWVKPYDFQSKALTPKSLKDITQEDSSFIFNQFLEILRHNVVSDKPNAFNKIFTLFLCKIYDEKYTKDNQELDFQWLEGKDDHISFQKRLTDLYRKGMKTFLEKEVTDLSDSEFEKKFKGVDESIRKQFLDQLTEIRLKKNNEFAIKEVFDDDSFQENAKVVKEVVELLQGFKIRYTKKQQYLSDFFELLLTTGLKQESGQFFTPVPIAQFIIKSIPIDKLVHEKLDKGEMNNLLPTIIDYAAGSGHFITESMHELQRIIDKTDSTQFHKDTQNEIDSWKIKHFDWAFDYVYGIEKDYRLVKVGKVGCYLHGDGLAKIVHSDGLGSFAKTDEYKELLRKTDKDFPQENKQFDICVSNPPYSVSAFRNNARKYYTETDFELYDKLTDQSSEIECLFIERTKQLLKDGGVAGIILPSSILSNTGIYTKAREIILQYFDIIAIAEFGSNTFMATGTNTVTLFLRRRNNYESINIRKSIEKAVADAKDVTINGIEKSFSKYVAHVWEDVSFSDYATLLKKQPNEAIENHEIYQEYQKKIAAKDNAEKWDKIIEIETEKLFYFILAYKQKIVLVKSGEKQAEKQFLGYEFSNRRGSEGIHPIQRGKAIDECTRLFDADIFDNPEKASTYIYHAFNGDYETPIDESLTEHISRQNLVEIFTFDRVDFGKEISLAVKKKVKIETKWEVVRISDVCDIISGGTPSTNVAEYWNGEIPWLSIADFNNTDRFVFETEKTITEAGLKNSSTNYLKKDDLIISARGTVGAMAQLVKPMTFNQSCYGLRGNERISNGYLYYALKSGIEQFKDNSYGAIFGAITVKSFDLIKIPLPPKDVQEKVVAEIEVLEAKEARVKAEIEELKSETSKVLIDSNQNGEIKRLGDVCNMKAGEFTTTQDISHSKDTNLYPCYGGNGLRGYTKTFTHEGIFPLIGRQGALCGNVHRVKGKFHATEHAVVVAPFQNIDVNWLYYQLEAMNLNQYKTGIAQPGLSVQNLKAVPIPVPSLAIQQKIVSQITEIENKIVALENEIAAIPRQKEAILKKYL